MYVVASMIQFFQSQKIGHQVRQKTGEVLLSVKAWNCRVICQWMADTMPVAGRGLDLGHDHGRVTLATHAVNLVHELWVILIVSRTYILFNITLGVHLIIYQALIVAN